MTVYRTAFEEGPAGWIVSPGLPPASEGGFVIADPQRTSSGVQIAQFGSDRQQLQPACRPGRRR